ncbi:TolC family protein [Polaribacter dokdonensis]|uniref:Outer membrane efflux protein n=1 Tax=Polaribacter dokdonensis DSW-5 TaxID=1300348 RepID=A0A0M9CFY1_9FLAO|nr:TolC family protein [Polaribacter dokdonensis]KOY51683.1 Outer membrane efflux protein [Polaribacter dokdonensis DSW-5]SEE05637.1 Outer membrane protein TolC [Polaribacter dokdonensis DSW-5]
MNKYFYVICFLVFTLTSRAQESPITLSLNKAIDLALENSYNTRAAANDIASAKEKVWETTTIGLPQINGAIDYQNFLKQPITVADINGDGVDEEFVFGTKQNVNASVTLSQLLFDGTYLVGLQSAKTFLKISEQAKEKTDLVTREAVINAYGNVLISENSILILENNIKILQKNYDDAKKIYENGLNEEEDVEQLLITLGDVKNQLNSVKRLNEIAYQMLNLTLGNSIDTKLVLTDTLDSLTEENITIDLVGETFLFENHIDYRIAENDREAKRLMMRLEQSKNLPSLSAFVNYGTQAFSNEFSFFDNNQRWFQSSLLGVSLKVPIFSSFGRKSKTAQAKIALNTADLRLEETKQRLELQAKKAKSDYQLSIESYQTAKKNLGLAERIEKKQRIKFFEGLSSSFNLLQAQTQLYTQQQNYIQSMLNVITNKAALENALNIPIK